MTEAMHQILLIEDDAAIRQVVRVLLETVPYRVVEAASLARGAVEARSHKPDLVLLDLGLPDGDGATLIREVRSWSPMPIIVLSARVQETQKIAALDAGADDYVTKPFSAPELLARVRAALRRHAQGSEQLAGLDFGPVRVDMALRRVHGADGEMHLTPVEFRVLESLARRAGTIVMQDALIREVWGPGHGGDTRNLRVAIKNLRAKLEPDPRQPRYLLTEVGLGYRLVTRDAR